jgi:hypothetical protein
MNQPGPLHRERPAGELADGVPLSLAEIALALLAPDEGAGDGAAPEAVWLAQRAAAVGAFARDRGLVAESRAGEVRVALAAWQQAPPADDRPLLALTSRYRLSFAESVALALAQACEFAPMVARVLIWLQQPVAEARPTAGLVDSLSGRAGEPHGLVRIAEGAARRHGMLQSGPDSRPFCEQCLTVPLPLLLALGGHEGLPEGVEIELEDAPVLPPSVLETAARQAAGLMDGGARVLVVRSGQQSEARAVAARVVGALGARAAFITGEPPRGLGPWLWLRGLVPVLPMALAPGERRRLPSIAGHHGPVLVVCGLDGSIEAPGAVAQWRVPIPSSAERVTLWRMALGEDAGAERLAAEHRHAAGRIAELAQAARSAAARDGEPLRAAHVARVARAGAGADLGALAELLSDDVPDDALVLSAELRVVLETLIARSRLRDELASTLGTAARVRYRPGVRALFVGPSGTGKTLAAGWVATRLGLPLYRVDLASVTSKYIGETEKNLAELFARAEHAEVVLLFDEADSLFGKRTDVKDANDRFANQQTNYLLQRIETFEGISILTSNSRARFDAAFTRRLDAIVEFPSPGPEERRALWVAHLGERHVLDVAALNRLAAGCDLAGGHIRNVVLAAAAQALQRGTAMDEEALRGPIAAEYRKLGKPVPPGLYPGAGP